MIVEALLASFGLFGSTSVPSSSAFPGGPARVVNLGLLGEQMALFMLGGSVMVVGAVFVAGATIARAVADAEQRALALLQRQAQPAAAAPGAPRFTERPILRREDYDAGWAEVEAAAVAQGWAFLRQGHIVKLRREDGVLRQMELVGMTQAREFFKLPPLAPKKADDAAEA